jgi:transcriptional regulator with XRE-family HTH domain
MQRVKRENWKLRWERQRRGWSQDDVVDRLQEVAAKRGAPEPGVDRNTVSRWERGISRPTPRYIQLLSAVFGAPPEDLGLVSPPPPPPSGPAPPWDPPRIAELLGKLRPDVDRRTFLRQAAGVAGIAAGLTTFPSPPEGEPWERLVHALSRPLPLDPELVTNMETLTTSLHDLEARMPARQLIAQLSLHLDRLADLLQGTTTEQQRRRLVGTAGDTAVLGAWVAWDMGDRPGAFRLYETAITAAREGDDPALRACILAYASYGASADGDARRARDLLELARQSVEGKGYPATYAWISCRQAEETAALGEEQAALRLLESGLTSFQKAESDTERVWTRFLDPARVGGFAVSVYGRVGDTGSALRVAEQVLTSVEPDHVKKRSLLLAGAAEAHLRRGDLDVGLELADQALVAAQASETSWGYQSLARLRPLLDRWPDNAEVRQLGERLAGLGA